MKKIIWDTYFDPSISRKFGRRIGKVTNFERLEDAIKSLGLDYKVVESRYPRIPWKKSKKFEIEWNKSKRSLIKEIEKKLREEKI